MRLNMEVDSAACMYLQLVQAFRAHSPIHKQGTLPSLHAQMLHRMAVAQCFDRHLFSNITSPSEHTEHVITQQVAA